MVLPACLKKCSRSKGLIQGLTLRISLKQEIGGPWLTDASMLFIFGNAGGLSGAKCQVDPLSVAAPMADVMPEVHEGKNIPPKHSE